jgi:hypothetical protein
MVATLKRPEPQLGPEAEAFVAHLTRAAYDVALRHGITGAFADLELAMWREMRAIVGACQSDIVEEPAFAVEAA